MSIKNIIYCCLLFGTINLTAQNTADAPNLIMALLGETPIEEDLQELCDLYGGRVTGTTANLEAVEWGLDKFKSAGVVAEKELFTIASLWIDNSTIATVSGATNFTPKVVAKCYSKSTPKNGLKLPIIDVGYGTEEDFAKLGDAVRGKFVLLETDLCLDVDGLFEEYSNAALVDARAVKAGAIGIINMASRPKKLLYRFIASGGTEHGLVNLVMAREDAKRCQRILRSGGNLDFELILEVGTDEENASYNVLAEIKGTERPDEVVIIGAHLDSWGLGTGANDNGCNVAMMIDIARQMKKNNIQPKRTIRFALWNGEEQGYFGSWGYTKTHQKELDKHIMAMSVDIGSGAINGFFTNGRPIIQKITKQIAAPVATLGAKTMLDVPIIGTDNFDFMLEGVANLVASHQPFNYGQNYHASSDTYDKVDLEALKINSAIVAAVTLGFANLPAEEVTWKRQSHAEVAALIEQFNLEFSMRMFGVWKDWESGKRGRSISEKNK